LTGLLDVEQKMDTDMYAMNVLMGGIYLYILQVACGDGHALALSLSGRVFSWGNGSCGRLGLDIQTLVGTDGVVDEPQRVHFNSSSNSSNNAGSTTEQFVVQVSCGGAHSAVVTAEGMLVKIDR
jgi:alpha-tubulin suppressor-like RCC1 family protein